MPWRLGTESFEFPGISGSPEAQPVVETTLSTLPKLDVGWRELIASPKIGQGISVPLGNWASSSACLLAMAARLLMDSDWFSETHAPICES